MLFCCRRPVGKLAAAFDFFLIGFGSIFAVLGTVDALKRIFGGSN